MAHTHPNYVWDHVHIRTPDIEGMARWFAETLGAEIVRTGPRVDLKLGGANIFLIDAPATMNPPPTTPYQGLDHFGLTVTDIDAAADSLKAKGIEFTTQPTTIRPGVRICFIRGPLGISIELLERDKKYQMA